ncbi:MAG: hypothetical protein ABTD50_09825 [Polyangiaceae bacterium]|jgi:hypothetical protein
MHSRPPPLCGARFVTLALSTLTAACVPRTVRSVVEQHVAPAPPPADDGKPATGGAAGPTHSAALEELAVAPLVTRWDPQHSVRAPLPDGAHWTLVRFLGVPSLAGFRYGKDHHAVAGAFVMPVTNEREPGACAKAFEASAQPWIDSFEVAIEHGTPKAIPWHDAIIAIDSLVATTATLGLRDQYAGAYATYPAWKGSCLVFGVAVPARGDLERALAARDRFVREVFPALEVTTSDRPRKSY